MAKNFNADKRILFSLCFQHKVICHHLFFGSRKMDTQVILRSLKANLTPSKHYIMLIEFLRFTRVRRQTCEVTVPVANWLIMSPANILQRPILFYSGLPFLIKLHPPNGAAYLHKGREVLIE